MGFLLIKDNDIYKASKIGCQKAFLDKLKELIIPAPILLQ